MPLEPAPEELCLGGESLARPLPLASAALFTPLVPSPNGLCFTGEGGAGLLPFASAILFTPLVPSRNGTWGLNPRSLPWTGLEGCGVPFEGGTCWLRVLPILAKRRLPLSLLLVECRAELPGLTTGDGGLP